MSIEVITIQVPGLQGPPGDPGEFGGPGVPSPVLKVWAHAEAWAMTSVNRDGEGVITTATVTWPDGSTGTFTRTHKNSEFLAIDGFTVTHAQSGKTVTQPLVTRTPSGGLQVRPDLTIT